MRNVQRLSSDGRVKPQVWKKNPQSHSCKTKEVFKINKHAINVYYE